MSNKDNALEFAMALDKARLQKEDDIAEKVQEIAMDAFGMIIKRTPVDTGRLRSNWIASNTTPNTAKFEQVVNPQTRIDNAATVISQYDPKNDKSIIIQNNMEYAKFIEFGTSRMAAQPMIAPTMNVINHKYRDVLV